VRLVEGLSGRVELTMRFVLRFSYGAAVPWVRRATDRHGRDCLLAVAGPDAVCLRGDVLPVGEHRRHVADFAVAAGESVSFTMVWFPSTDPIPDYHPAGREIARTAKYWQRWASMCTYDGPHRAAVVRSLITLKALSYSPTGGIVAAVTTSLPEEFGGNRNWDYRFCWLRDATLTLWSLLISGYREEAEAWRSWLLRAIAGDPEDLQIVYGAAGERQLPEYELDWLPGYQGARPVRVGNAAAKQFQLDVYGEVLNALHQAREVGIAEDDFSWPVQLALLDFLAANWQRPDKGLWEVRGPDRQFTHSRVMVWVAFDRAVRAVEEYGCPGPVERWRELRAAVYAEVCERAWNPEVGAFTQFYGGRELDAAVLMMPMVGFLPAEDERMIATVHAIERELTHDGLVYRYSTGNAPGGSPGAPAAGNGEGDGEGDDDGDGDDDGGPHPVDGLAGTEAAFLACSFWLVDNYARAGQLAKASTMFGRLLALCNDVGLLAEEYDPTARRQAGNFPQAFSHVALVNTAHSLAMRGVPAAADLVQDAGDRRAGTGR
jgi:GH15 family glucan-1,4-alpha-glucosidase